MIDIRRIRAGLAVVVSVITTALLAGCAATGGYDAPDTRPAPGAAMELTQTLEMPYRGARRYIQGGEPIGSRDVNRFEPFCSIRLNRKRDGRPLMERIEPGTFAIRDTRLTRRVSMTELPPIQVASGYGSYGYPQRIASILGGKDGGGTPSFNLYVTEFTLYSDEQPQVERLTCAYDGNPVGRHLTLDQIQDTLGDLIRII